ncbi:DUF4037 domain-containing protein [Bifidobacterium sp. ESL0790]|uniref:DUF4037 domain-containing protein n=1 Tax=Bifidobacterium sp. ESL0790 TaxID=2983233 RepID=UPI0023F7E3F1|nr:DUF4037 domain-containing protein [Bifidobacterium sp. ESL0790]WEV73140.1 DUF4037 domain-containing protein [Bifidobacterium sp. ESL0790]
MADGDVDGETSDNDAPATFDTDEFLKGLDAIFDAHQAATKAEPYLLQAMTDAENAGDDAGLLTVLNETMGFYRSHGKHKENQWVIQRALELGLKMRIEGTEAWTTTLINAATGMRAAKQYDQAKDLYQQALKSAGETLSPTDRRVAALHNNISMLYSETGELEKAQHELEAALGVLEKSSVDAEADIDVASTHTNLALVLLQRASEVGNVGAAAGGKNPDQDATGSAEFSARNEADTTRDEAGSEAGVTRDELLRQAMMHATKALEIYENGHLQHSAHYASALAGYAQTCFAAGQFGKAVETYRKALDIIVECYGKDTDYYRITEANLAEAQKAADALKEYQERAAQEGEGANKSTATGAGDSVGLDNSGKSGDSSDSGNAGNAKSTPAIKGLKLARAYWETYGKPLIAEKYPEYQGRIAAGLVGHGSECYGFDDEFSHDHDFGPDFCLWLTDEDYAAIGERLEADYEALPQEFMGFGPREQTARTQGGSRRVGVFRIGDFFESITGYRQAPPADRPHEWLLLDEPTLAAATNGEVFADPIGLFSKTRQGFKMMPDDVRLSLISRRLGMIAQAGQYNLPRMLKRGDGAAAWLSIREFASNVISLVFLLNEPIRTGYMPYYKWQFAALRKLSGMMFALLPDVCAQLEDVLRLSSAACFGGAGFGEGGKGAKPAQEKIQAIVEHICGEIVDVLRDQGLTNSDETFLEWQRPYIEAHIGSDNPVLKSL